MLRSQHRFVLLDGFRGLAALLVVVFHAARDGSPFYKLDPLFLMVDFFFVLSGFVLLPGMPQQFSGFGQAAYQFIVKRVLRLWPMAVAAIALSAAMYYVSIWYVHRTGDGFNYDLTRTTHNYIAALLLWQIWVSKSMFMVVPLWSLSAEWFANLIYVPLVAVRRNIGIVVAIAGGYLLFRNGLENDREWISWIGPIRGHEALGRAVAGFGIGLLARKAHDATGLWGLLVSRAATLAGITYVAMSAVSDWVYANTPYQVESETTWIAVCCTAGIAGLLLPRAGSWVSSRAADIVAFGVALWLTYQLLIAYRDFGYGVIYAAPPVFALLVATAARISVDGERWLGRVMLMMGAWSYGVYVFHRIVMDFFNMLTAEPLHWYSTPIYMAPDGVWLHYVVLKVVVVTAVSVVLTLLATRFIERPVQQRGRRLLLRGR